MLRIGVLLAAVLWLLPACGYHGKESGPPAHLYPLSSVATLQAQFIHDQGRTRLILLFSPT